MGPLTIRDHTRVVAVEPPRHILLRARARPLGAALVNIRLAPEGRGRTRVVMHEHPAGAMPARVLNLPFDILLRGRNAEALRRLKAIVEGARG